jgi:phospholipid/cholesterol/gamma-HCH transport system substrate-binding protein
VRKASLAVLVVALGLAAVAFIPDDGEQVTLVARFDDVGDLAASAPVMMADVQVGKVDEIELDGIQALVTLSIDPGTGVPQGTIARIRRTSLLGERIVDLVIPETVPADAPLLQSGEEIQLTETRPDLEDLVREGVDVLAPIAASEVATLVDEGAKGFGGKGDELRTMLTNFEQIVDAYAENTDEIQGVIENVGQFNEILATKAKSHAKSVANSARAIGILREEIHRLEDAINALTRLSEGGRLILEDHSDEMSRFFQQMKVILGVLQEEQDSIELFLDWAPNHNQNTQITELYDFVQIYQDFIICGLNEDDDDPARNCKEGGGG